MSLGSAERIRLIGFRRRSQRRIAVCGFTIAVRSALHAPNSATTRNPIGDLCPQSAAETHQIGFCIRSRSRNRRNTPELRTKYITAPESEISMKINKYGGARSHPRTGLCDVGGTISTDSTGVAVIYTGDVADNLPHNP